MVGLFAWAQPQGEKWVRRRSFASHVALSVTAALAVAGVGLLAASLASQSPDPPAWSEFSKDARRLTWLAQTVGGLLGASSEVVLLDRCIGLDLRDSVPTRLFPWLTDWARFIYWTWPTTDSPRPPRMAAMSLRIPPFLGRLVADRVPCPLGFVPNESCQGPGAASALAGPSFVCRLQSAYERLARCCSRWSNPLAKV